MSSHCSKSPFQNAWSEGCLDYCPPGHYKSVSSNATNWTGGFIKYVFSNYVSKQSKCLENPGKLWNIERTQVLRTHTVPGTTRIWKDSNRPRSLDARIVWEKWSPPTHLFLQGFKIPVIFQETAWPFPISPPLALFWARFVPKFSRSLRECLICSNSWDGT